MYLLGVNPSRRQVGTMSASEHSLTNGFALKEFNFIWGVIFITLYLFVLCILCGPIYNSCYLFMLVYFYVGARSLSI